MVEWFFDVTSNFVALFGRSEWIFNAGGVI